MDNLIYFRLWASIFIFLRPRFIYFFDRQSFVVLFSATMAFRRSPFQVGHNVANNWCPTSFRASSRLGHMSSPYTVANGIIIILGLSLCVANGDK